MKSTKLMCAAAVLAGLIGTPAFAQVSNDAMMKKDGLMSSDSKMKISLKDKKMIARCNGMSHDMMMKNAGCMKMMKMHPDMMKGG